MHRQDRIAPDGHDEPSRRSSRTHISMEPVVVPVRRSRGPRKETSYALLSTLSVPNHRHHHQVDRRAQVSRRHDTDHSLQHTQERIPARYHNKVTHWERPAAAEKERRHHVDGLDATTQAFPSTTVCARRTSGAQYPCNQFEKEVITPQCYEHGNYLNCVFLHAR